MKQLAHVYCSLLVGILVAVPPMASAQDGPLRQRLNERLKQRHQADAETVADPAARITTPGDYRFTVTHNGEQRMYRVHVPAGYRPQNQTPLLVSLHGGGGNMDYQANDAFYGQITASDREGFVVVFPNGYSKFRSGKFATWNAGNCCGEARDSNIDDVGFIRQVVGQLTQQMNIDRKRIYATGMSNGAMMAYRLACEMPDVFRAVAAVAGTDNTRDCTPGNPVSVLHIHARNDTHVLFSGGAGPDSVRKALVTDFTSVDATVAKWVRANACRPAPKRILDKAGAYCDVYSPCRGGSEVQLCVTDGGGHSWPGAQKTRGGPASQAISANEVMWDFFQRQ